MCNNFAFNTVVGDNINTRKTIYNKLLNSMDTHKHKSQEKQSVKKGSLKHYPCWDT